jgi:hypothetical protein
MKDVKSRIILFFLDPIIKFTNKYGVNEITVIGIFALVCLFLLIRKESKKEKKDLMFLGILITGVLFILIAMISFS